MEEHCLEWLFWASVDPSTDMGTPLLAHRARQPWLKGITLRSCLKTQPWAAEKQRQGEGHLCAHTGPALHPGHGEVTGSRAPSQNGQHLLPGSPSHSLTQMLSYLGTLLHPPFSSPLPTSFFSLEKLSQPCPFLEENQPLPSLKPLPLMPCSNTSCQRSKSGAHCRPGHFWPPVSPDTMAAHSL